MKVIAPRGWSGVNATCPHCNSRIKVETDDVMYSRGDAEFYVQCGYCQKDCTIPEQALPKFLAREVYEKVMREPHRTVQ